MHPNTPPRAPRRRTNPRIAGLSAALSVALAAMLLAQSPGRTGRSPESSPPGPPNAATSSSGSAGAGAAGTAGGLVPTEHPPIPTKAAEAWLVPPTGAKPPSAAQRGFAEGVTQYSQGNYAQALLLVSDPRLETTSLAAYASYYTALCYLRLSRPSEARAVLSALRTRALHGFLTEAVPLAEAEAAAAAGDATGATRLLDELSKRPTGTPDVVLHRLVKAARAAGDELGARAAMLELYFEHPLSALPAEFDAEVAALRTDAKGAAAEEFSRRDLARAEKLFAGRRYDKAQAAFTDLRTRVSEDDEEVVGLRIAEADYFQGRHRQAITGLGPYLRHAARRAEARFFELAALRALGEEQDFVQGTHEFASEFPDSTWAADALDALATHHILKNDDAAAARVFERIVSQVASGRRYERAAWKLGWWRYKTGDHAGAAAVFEDAAVRAPRADSRPAWIYWAGRARDQLQERARANARFALVTVDYLNSYYGRLASTILEARGLEPGRRASALTAVREDGATAGHGGGEPQAARGAADARQGETPRAAALPPNADVVRTLLALELYDLANDELQFLRRTAGRSAIVDATLAWIYARQGDVRRGINTMKQAYPQYIAAGGEGLPTDVLRVIFPLDYWDLIRRHSAARELDPFVVAALVAQESSFLPAVRSPANAWGLMQIIPATGRRLARAEGIRRFSTSSLTNPEINVRLGTRHIAELVRRFGGVHYALASYNAGEQRIVRWKSERPGLDRDEFIDDIPFPETQNYVKKILGTAEDYRILYGSGRVAPTRLGQGTSKPAGSTVKTGSGPASKRKVTRSPRTRKPAAKTTKRPVAGTRR